MNPFKLILVLATALAVVPPSHGESLSGARPNILLVLTDDQGYGDLGCHGHPFVKTPNLDQLYSESTRFTDFHTSPTCAPARAGLMSGLHPFKVGVTHTIFDRERMALGVPTVAEVLKEAGYTTGIFGKWHLGDDTPYQPQSRGFDEVFIHGGGGIGQAWDVPDNNYQDPIVRHNGTFVQTTGFCTDVFFTQSMRWMREQQEKGRPFFSYLSLNAPHGPFNAPEKYKAKYEADQEPGFFGMITNIDDNMGVLMKKLKEWNLEKNTLVIFMTDNGSVKSRFFNARMQGGKNNAHEGGSRVPCFFRLPGRLKAGVEIEQLTRHFDILPTFADLAGADVTGMTLDGRSLVPLIENPEAKWPERTVFFHKGRWGNVNSKQAKHRINPSPEEGKYADFAVRDEKWRLVGTAENRLELFDIQSDPGETEDVAKSQRKTVRSMMAAYEAWWTETRPLMVNDGIELTGELYYRRDFLKQKKEGGIPEWNLSEAVAKTPNIVVFVADDMGWGDSGTYGHELIQTPNLDKLASRGVKLTQCYSACAVCSPSRSAILSGRHPYRNGVWRHLSGQHEAHLRASEITYPKLLKSIGYETCHVGKWHLNSLPQFNTTEFPQPGDHGYDYWMATHNNAHPSHKNPDNFVRNGKPIGEQQGYSAQVVAAEAIKWLSEERDKSKPFALSVWVHEPHSPIATNPKFESLYGDHDNRTYMGNISQLDHAVGQVMQTLDEEDVSRDTLFIFTSDNGPVARYGGTTGGLRGGKRSDHEGGIRVPGIVAWPGHITPGTTSSVPVVGTDIFATVLAITGIPLPDDRTIDGVNILPALAGNPVERPIPLFWRTHVSRPEDRVAMRIGDWKIVGDDTLTKFQLYEIEKDWKEEHDLAAAMPGKTEEMKNRLMEVWMAIEKEGPDHWWKTERNKPMKGAKINY